MYTSTSKAGQPARRDQRQQQHGRSAAAQALDRPARLGSPAPLLIAARGSIWWPGWRCWRCRSCSAAPARFGLPAGAAARLQGQQIEAGQLDQEHQRQQTGQPARSPRVAVYAVAQGSIFSTTRPPTAWAYR